MKKQIFSTVIVLMVLFGCTLKRYGRYTEKIFKTANSKVIVTGTVYDTNKSNGTIAEAGITSADTNYLTKTDNNGKYRIELREGKHILRAAFIGFKIASTKRLNLVKGDSLMLDFILKDSKEKTRN